MRNAVLVCLVLIALCAAVFGPTVRFEFVDYDDDGHVYDRPEIAQGLSPAGIAWVFSTTFVGNYIPVTGLTYLVDYELHEFDPGGYHLSNLVFHIAGTLLLFIFLFRTTGRLAPSALAAALFAIHPLHVESVAWISARKDVVSTFFWLAAMLAYAGYAKRPRVTMYLLTFVLFTFGLFAKPMLVTFPFVLLLLDVWPLQRIDAATLSQRESRLVLRRLILEKLPFFIPVIAVSIVTMLIQQRLGAISTITAASPTDRIANALIAYVAYLGKMLWPAELIVPYPYNPPALLSVPAMAAALFLLVVTIAALRFRGRAPYLAVGWLWYLGTLVPVIGFLQVGSQSMADRYTYVTLIGIFIAGTWIMDDLSRTRGPVRAALVVVGVGLIGLLSALSVQQTEHWKSTTTLFEHTLRYTPGNRIALSNLGAVYLKEERTDEAIRVLEKAVKVSPGSLVVRRNLAVAYRQMQRYADAREQLARALTLAPDEARSHYDMGRILMHLGDNARARQRFESALEREPNHIGARVSLGNVLFTSGKAEEAIAQYRYVLDRNPEYADALSNMGAALIAIGEYERALLYLQRVLGATPDDAVTRLNLAVCYYELKRFEEARAAGERALREKPGFDRAQRFLELFQ